MKTQMIMHSPLWLTDVAISRLTLKTFKVFLPTLKKSHAYLIFENGFFLGNGAKL